MGSVEKCGKQLSSVTVTKDECNEAADDCDDSERLSFLALDFTSKHGHGADSATARVAKDPKHPGGFELFRRALRFSELLRMLFCIQMAFEPCNFSYCPPRGIIASNVAHKIHFLAGDRTNPTTMRLSISSPLALAATLSVTHAYTPVPSRRAFLTRAVTAGATCFGASCRPASAADTSEQQKEKEEEKRRKEQEKEARRQAEETKKRLAVGRIGTI